MKRMKRRTKVKIHNFLVEASAVIAGLSYMTGVFYLEIDWIIGSRICLLALGYLLFWMSVNYKYILETEAEDEDGVF